RTMILIPRISLVIPCSVPLRALHSFPTRRSSDLGSGGSMIYQIRDATAARMLLQTDNKEEVKHFLGTRNPDLYEVFFLAALTKEIRHVCSGRAFLNERSKTARPEA